MDILAALAIGLVVGVVSIVLSVAAHVYSTKHDRSNEVIDQLKELETQLASVVREVEGSTRRLAGLSRHIDANQSTVRKVGVDLLEALHNIGDRIHRLDE